MATNSAKAEMDKTARQRLDKAIQTLARRFDIDPLASPRLARDPDLARIYQLEDFAGFLEGLVKATKDIGVVKADKPEGEPLPEIDPDSLDVLRDAEGAPVDVPPADDMEPSEIAAPEPEPPTPSVDETFKAKLAAAEKPRRGRRTR